MRINKSLHIASLVYLVSLIPNLFYAQPDIKVYAEQTREGYKIEADNNEYCDVSVYLELELTNLRSTRGNNKVFVIPARARSYKITELDVANRYNAYRFRYSTRTNFGNHKNKKYDDDHVYQLPFSTKDSVRVIQGYYGLFSHHNEKALDFKLPEGTDVLAAREGVVVAYEDGNKLHCPKPECISYNNYILIIHKDGTFAEYVHLQHKGVLVKKGQKVKVGELIGKSGNTGFSTSPHLHFSVYQQKMEEKITIPTVFEVAGSELPIQLEEGVYYTHQP